MNLADVDKVIQKLGQAVSGQATALPGNEDIVAAFAFLRKHLQADDAVSTTLANRLASQTIRIDSELASGLSSMRDRLAERMQVDEKLSTRVLYIANRIPREERISNSFFALVLFAYAGFALKIDDFYIPGKRSNGVHLHGAPVWVMFAATLCAVIVLLATVIDHYDTRPNERAYQRLAKVFRVLGWTLFGLAFIADIALKFRH